MSALWSAQLPTLILHPFDPRARLIAACCQVLVPQKLFILRTKISFFPSNAVSLADSTPILDAAGRMVLFKVRPALMGLAEG